MRLRFRSSIFILALCSVAATSVAADLALLDKGRNVHLAMIGQGPLCDAKVDSRSADLVIVRVWK